MVSCYVGAAETAWTEDSGQDLALANTNFTDTNIKHLVDLLKLRLPDYQATAQIVEYIAEHENVLLLDKVLSGREIGILGYSLKQTNFDLDIISLQNNDLEPFAVTCFIAGMFANLGHGIVHSVVYLNLANNNLGDGGVENLAKALIKGQLTGTKAIDVSGNNITNYGAKYLAQALESGKVNNLQKLDVSGNNITEVGETNLVQALQGAKVRGGIIIVTHKVEWAETGPMAQFAKNIRGPFNETVDALIDGAKKQGTLAFGTKEAKQAIIGGWLESAQSKGVDTKNVVVSKDIFDTLGNVGSLTKNFLFGWVKCSVVPENVQSVAADIVITKVSQKAAVVITGVDIALCYFESCDEAMSSQHGVQFLGDLRLLKQEEFIDSIE